MTNILKKDWAAIDDDENIVARADTEGALHKELENHGISEEEIEVVALPKSHSSLYL